MLSTKQIHIGKNNTFFELFCSLLQDKLRYATGERDVVIMHHVFCISNKQGEESRLSSTMVVYGDPNGYSAMAKTVGLPTAIAAEMILNGRIFYQHYRTNQRNWSNCSDGTRNLSPNA